MSDWTSTGLHTADTEKKAQDIRRQIDETIGSFYEEQKAQGTKRSKDKKPPNELVANREAAIALDHALESAGLSLRHFKPERRVGALSRSEVRYYSELPSDRQLVGSNKVRSCIHNQDTGKCEVEVPRLGVAGGVAPPALCLHKSLDEGSVGMSMAHWIDCGLGLRGSNTEDFWHRLFNDMKNSLVENNLWVIILETTIVFNVTTAPFGSHSFFAAIMAASQEYFETRSPECPLFRSLYEDRTSQPTRAGVQLGSKSSATFSANSGAKAQGFSGVSENLGSNMFAETSILYGRNRSIGSEQGRRLLCGAVGLGNSSQPIQLVRRPWSRQGCVL